MEFFPSVFVKDNLVNYNLKLLTSNNRSSLERSPDNFPL